MIKNVYKTLKIIREETKEWLKCLLANLPERTGKVLRKL